jgi:hypothetical protein
MRMPQSLALGCRAVKGEVYRLVVDSLAGGCELVDGFEGVIGKNRCLG